MSRLLFDWKFVNVDWRGYTEIPSHFRTPRNKISFDEKSDSPWIEIPTDFVLVEVTLLLLVERQSVCNLHLVNSTFWLFLELLGKSLVKRFAKQPNSRRFVVVVVVEDLWKSHQICFIAIELTRVNWFSKKATSKLVARVNSGTDNGHKKMRYYFGRVAQNTLE